VLIDDGADVIKKLIKESPAPNDNADEMIFSGIKTHNDDLDFSNKKGNEKTASNSPMINAMVLPKDKPCPGFFNISIIIPITAVAIDSMIDER